MKEKYYQLTLCILLWQFYFPDLRTALKLGLGPYRRLHGQTAGHPSSATSLVDPMELDIQCLSLDVVGKGQIFHEVLDHAVQQVDGRDVQELRFAGVTSVCVIALCPDASSPV